MTGMGFFDHQSYEFWGGVMGFLGKMDEIVQRGSGNQVSGLVKSFIDMHQFPETYTWKT